MTAPNSLPASGAIAPLLPQIASPRDLRALPRSALGALCQEIRQFLLESVSKTGGHLSSNLGTVELSVALHYVFDTPTDRLIWDVGHQCYAHKILTGRREQMHSLRQLHGLSGFPKRSESDYDAFGTAHSSTSISAALGMAQAANLLGQKRQVIAVIGDGALTAGMAFEALNNAGAGNADLLVILNDNNMSISPPVGALNRYLARLLTGSLVEGARSAARRFLQPWPRLLRLARRVERHIKGFFTPATIFEELGFHYAGPINGHDLDSLIPTLQNLRSQHGPRFLHVITRKGQGYKFAEADPVAYHGPGQFNLAQGLHVAPAPPSGQQSFSEVFGRWLCDRAAADARLVGITPAMCEGSGMTQFRRLFPSRYFDVDIAEQHAVTFAAGLATEGLRPVVAIYSTFLQRAYDQAIHDVALQNLPVLFALDRAGLVGADGASHAGNYDIAYLRCIPQLSLLTPSDGAECYAALQTAYEHPGPTAVRYPRGNANVTAIDPQQRWEWGRGRWLRRGVDIAILAFGTFVQEAREVAERLNASLADMRFIKPLDADLILQAAREHRLLVTLEDAALAGGAGSAVSEFLHQQRSRTALLSLGYPDTFIEQGTRAQLHESLGLHTLGIEQNVISFLANLPGQQI